MVTALDDPQNVVKAFYQGGADSYLVKPIEKDKLEQELKNLGLLNHAPKNNHH
jgi:two-component system chemotaxis response regulator CheY